MTFVVNIRPTLVFGHWKVSYHKLYIVWMKWKNPQAFAIVYDLPVILVRRRAIIHEAAHHNTRELMITSKYILQSVAKRVGKLLVKNAT